MCARPRSPRVPVAAAHRRCQVAREMPNVKFIKVDVQRSYVGVQIRSMPTFHFYLQAWPARSLARCPGLRVHLAIVASQGKLHDQFSGAGEQQLRQMAQASRGPSSGLQLRFRPAAVHAPPGADLRRARVRRCCRARRRRWTSWSRSATSRSFTKSTTRRSSTRSAQPLAPDAGASPRDTCPPAGGRDL